MKGADSDRRWDAVTPLDQLPDIVTVVDAYAQRQYASPTIQPILGYDPASLAGASAFDHVHPDDLARLHQIFEAGVEASHRSVGAIFRYRTADDDWILLESIGVNLLDDPRIGAIIIDTCVVRHSMTTPPETVTPDAHPDTGAFGLFVLDTAGEVITATETAATLLGQSLEELFETPLVDAICDGWRGNQRPVDVLERTLGIGPGGSAGAVGVVAL